MNLVARPGWYVDWSCPGSLRYWNGSTWTSYWRSPVEPAGDQLEHVLDHAVADGVIDRVTRERLLAELVGAGGPPTQAAGAVGLAAAARPALRPAPARRAHPFLPPEMVPDLGSSVGTPVRKTQPHAARTVAPMDWPAPSPARTSTRTVSTPKRPSAFARIGELIGSDLAIHGLAYLGVLLVFTGLFGLVVLSFGDLQRGLRPLTELLVPVTLAGAAHYLRRRRALVVATALSVVAAALVPVMAITFLVDGVAPDLTGRPLATVAALVAAVCAGAFALAARRRPDTAVRYLVGPMAWVAVAFAARVPGGGSLAGKAIATVQPGQVAAFAVAVSASAAAAARWPTARWSRPTRLGAVPGLAMATVLALLAGARVGWPVAGPLVTALAVLVGIEAVAPLLPARSVGPLQALAVGWAALALGADVSPAWRGAAAAAGLLALAEWHAARGRDAAGLTLAAGGAGVGLAVALTGAWPGVAALTVASLWAQARRTWRIERLPVALVDALAALLPLGAAASLLRALPTDTAALTMAVAVLAVAVAVRVLDRTRDGFWRAWVPAAAALAGLVSLGRYGVGRPVLLVGAAAAATLAAALSTAPTAVRTWLAAGLSVATGALALEATGLAGPWQAVVLGGAGAVAVALDLRAEAVWRQHVTLAGSAATTVAVALAWPGRPAGEIALAAAVAAWSLVALADETGRLSATRALRHPLVAGGRTPGVGAAVALTGLPLLALRATGALEPSAVHTPGTGLVVGAVALAYLVGARVVDTGRPATRSPLVALLVGFGWALGLGGIAGTVPSPGWAAVAALVPVAAPFLVPAARRGRVLVATAWSATTVVAVGTALAAGVPDARWHQPLGGWGAVLLAGALTVDRARHGGRTTPGWVRTPALGAPALVGAIAFVVGLAFVATLTRTEGGWWALGAAVVVATVAGLTSAGAVSGAAWALAAVGLAAVAPFDAWRHPWTLGLAAAVPLVAARLLARPERSAAPWWARWDLPAFLAAHVVALAAVVLAPAHGAVAVTWLIVAVLAATVAVVRHEVTWAVAAAALALGAAVDAGPGWRTGALALLAVVATARSVRATGPARIGLHVAGVVTAAGAWVSLADWVGWNPTATSVASALGAGALALVVGTVARARRPRRDALAGWGVLAGATVLAAVGRAVEIDRRPVWLAAAAGACSLAAGAALAAEPVRWRWLRDVSALSALVGVVTFTEAFDAGTPARVALGAGVALFTVAALAIVQVDRPASPWLRPTTMASLGAIAWALAAAPVALPARGPLAVTLLAAGVQSVVLGWTWKRPEVQLAAPVLVCAAWLTVASGVLTGDPSWFTLPIGTALLGEAGLVRRALRARGESPAQSAVGLLEGSAMALMALPPLVETVSRHVGFGALAAAIGVVLATWGALTEVRRRLAGGLLTVAAALALLLGVPLARLVPQAGAPVLWLAMVVVGLVAVIAAAGLEQGRARVRRLVRRAGRLTDGWE